MKISIITVCFNSEKTIEDTIKSVLSQNYNDVEYIVVDGASKDRTIDILNKYRNEISTIISEPDRGIYDAMNKGINVATGDWIGILNSDDFFANNDVLSCVASFVKHNESADIVYGDVNLVEAGITSKVTRHYVMKNFKPWKLRVGLMPPHPSTFVKVDVYKRNGLYKTDYKVAADFEFYVRCSLKKNNVILRIPKLLVLMREGGISTSGLNWLFVNSRELAKALRDNGLKSNSLVTSLRLPVKLFSKYFKTSY